MTKKKKSSKVDDEYLEGELEENSSNDSLTAEEIYTKYTVAELKDILKANGLTVSGKKQDLVERVLPLLNNDSIETSDEIKNEFLLQTDDFNSSDKVNYPFMVEDDSLSSSLGIFGINFNDLVIKDETIDGENTNLTIQGFSQKGLSMSDSIISVVNDSDSSSVDLKINVPEVSFSDFKSNFFTFKNLDLFILPNSNSNSPELSARMDSLELISDKNYVNLKDLIFLFKIFPDERGIHLDINIKEFIYPNFNYTSFNFENLHFNMEIGLNGQSFDISINLPTLSLINKNYKLNLSDLNLNIGLSDLKLSNLDLSILLSDFNYTNFDDVHVNMDNINVSLEPILNVNSFDIIFKMDSFDTAGVTFNDMFPMLNIDTIKLKNSTTDMESPINLTGHISPIDIYQMDLASIASLLSSGFDLNTYMRNMPDYDSYLDVDANDSSGFNLESIFKNFDNSSLDGIVLNLSGIIDSAGIDLSDLGIDVSGYDLSAIKLSDIICILNKSNLNISTITSIYNYSLVT